MMPPTDSQARPAPYRLPFAARLLVSLLALAVVVVPTTALIAHLVDVPGDLAATAFRFGIPVTAVLALALTLATRPTGPTMTLQDYFVDLAPAGPETALQPEIDPEPVPVPEKRTQTTDLPAAAALLQPVDISKPAAVATTTPELTGQAPKRRSRCPKVRRARMKSTFRKSGHNASQK